MTEKQLRANFVKTAQSYLGCKESNGSHKKIIDIYNAHKPLARNYKVMYADAWCATFVSAMAIKCGLTDIMPTECGCGQMIQLYAKKGRWKESDSYIPEPGDIIMYDWDDSGKGDCSGWPEHVGIVVSVSGNTIRVIEGNISNSVAYRNISVNGKYIRGYCLPDFASKATDEEEPIDAGLEQFVREVQAACGAAVDGEAGPETIGKTVTVSAFTNRTHAVVRAVQKRLYALGYIEVGNADGEAGPKFDQAVRNYQSDNGCVIDGEITAGHKTWRKLLGME